MRTTVDLKDDAHKIVKAVAIDKGTTMGDVLSDLVYKRYCTDEDPTNDFTDAGFLKIRSTRPVTNDDVQRLEEEEDEHKLLSSGWMRLDRTG